MNHTTVADLVYLAIAVQLIVAVEHLAQEQRAMSVQRAGDEDDQRDRDREVDEVGDGGVVHGIPPRGSARQLRC